MSRHAEPSLPVTPYHSTICRRGPETARLHLSLVGPGQCEPTITVDAPAEIAFAISLNIGFSISNKGTLSLRVLMQR